MEKIRPLDPPKAKGTTLKQLAPFAENRYRGYGPKVSERIFWLADAIETVPFWQSLNTLMADDDIKRHSVGGIFFHDSGDKRIGEFTWNEVFTSLDHFLREFDGRATEYIFRDFKPQIQERNLSNMIEATRILALDKYPRLRRLYWDDYSASLENPTFWQSLIQDLSSLRRPVSSLQFFWTEGTKTGKSELRQIGTSLERSSVLNFLRDGQLGDRARFLTYYNLSQIIRDVFGQDPRQFFLNYETESSNPNLKIMITQAKSLLETTILPLSQTSEPKEPMGRREFSRLMKEPGFWEELIKGVENHSMSPVQTYLFNYFLRTYDSDRNKITNRQGTFAHLLGPFSGKTVKKLKNNERAGKRLVNYLMWGFKPNVDLQELVLDAKRLCAEMFPQDCLYVALQLPEFWDELTSDLEKMQGSPTFSMFLRYFGPENISSNVLLKKPGKTKYHRYLERAYHKQTEFNEFCRELGISVSSDFKVNLANLFMRFAPFFTKQILFAKFPQDFDTQRRDKKRRDNELLERAKSLLRYANTTHDKKANLEFETVEEAAHFRKKVASAGRYLNLPISTRIEGKNVTVRIKERKRLSAKEEVKFESVIKEMREQGKQNKDIASILGFEDHFVESIVTKLIKRGELKPRK